MRNLKGYIYIEGEGLKKFSFLETVSGKCQIYINDILTKMTWNELVEQAGDKYYFNAIEFKFNQSQSLTKWDQITTNNRKEQNVGSV